MVKIRTICRCDEEFTPVPDMPQKHLPDCPIVRDAWDEFNRLNFRSKDGK